MGLKEWFFRRQIKKIQKQSALDSVLDEAIKDAVKRSADASKTADKILKLKTVELQTNKTLKKIQELSDDEEEEEDEEEEDFATGIIKDLAQNFIKSKMPTQQGQQIADIVNKMSPEQLAEAKRKFLDPYS